MTESVAAGRERVAEIDLLRFLAAAAVVWFHYTYRGFAADHLTGLPYSSATTPARFGYLGVDLFFMISGFVILLTAWDATPRRFAVSRFARLVPAFWICCLITFVVTCVAGRAAVTIPQFFVNLTMLAEFLRVPSVDGVYWSLYVELRFYALVMIILLLGLIQRVRLLALLWLCAAALVTFVRVPFTGMILIPDYAAYFIAGAVFFMVFRDGWTWLDVALLLGCFGLSLVWAGRRAQAMATHFPSSFSLWTVGGIVAAFFAIFVLIASRKTAAIGRGKWLVLGALTYPLYLLHQSIGYAIFDAVYPRLNREVVVSMTATVMIAASWLVHRFVERPLGRAIRDRFRSSP